MTTALIAEDEPLLATELGEELGALWPELRIVSVVHDGHAALASVAACRPDIAFLDVRMPGIDGLEVARRAAPPAHVVFITAFDDYAIEAFDAGAVDYLLKPLDPDRLARAIARLKSRLERPPADLSALFALLAQTRQHEPLRYITVLRGREIRFIAVDEICYFRADAKYVAVVTADDEALITTPLKDLIAQLDQEVFWQIHRGVVVNIGAVKSVSRSLSGQLELRLKARTETLRVGPSFSRLFKHM